MHLLGSLSNSVMLFASKSPPAPSAVNKKNNISKKTTNNNKFMIQRIKMKMRLKVITVIKFDFSRFRAFQVLPTSFY